MPLRALSRGPPPDPGLPTSPRYRRQHGVYPSAWGAAHPFPNMKGLAMKRFIAMGTAVVAAALIIGAAVAVSRPNWLPAAVRARLPFAQPGGAAETASEDAGLYCKEHGVPEKFCTLCHEELTRQAPALQGARQHPRGHLHALPPRGGEEVQHRDVPEGARAAQGVLLQVRQGPSASARPARRRLVRHAQQARGRSAPSAPRTRGRSAPSRRAKCPRSAASRCRPSGSPRPSSPARSASRRPW